MAKLKHETALSRINNHLNYIISHHIFLLSMVGICDICFKNIYGTFSII
jgi:hypothetical protein